VRRGESESIHVLNRMPAIFQIQNGFPCTDTSSELNNVRAGRERHPIARLVHIVGIAIALCEKLAQDGLLALFAQAVGAFPGLDYACDALSMGSEDTHATLCQLTIKEVQQIADRWLVEMCHERPAPDQVEFLRQDNTVQVSV